MMSEAPVVSAYFLVGPTAVGKSAVAQWIAERHGYDVLSADSMVVYMGMDIGTAKPTRAERARVRHYGVDITTPDQNFSVWQYRRYAAAVLQRNAERKRKTVVGGGSGLYIKSLTDGLSGGPGPDPAQRAELEKILESDGIEGLQRILRQIAPHRLEQLRDRKNPRRLIRAIEAECQPQLQKIARWGKPSERRPLVGLVLPRDQLRKRITERVYGMYEKGLLDEVRRLMDDPRGLSRTARQAIGYAEAIDHIEGRCGKEKAIERTIQRTLQFAKRQITWFRHQANVEWIEIDLKMSVAEISRRVLEQWRLLGPTPIAP